MNRKIEKIAVKYFYKNQNIKIKEEEIVLHKENSIVDVSYNKENFQIKEVPAEYKEVEGRLNKEKEVKLKNTTGSYFIKSKQILGSYNIKEFIKNFIKEPIKKVLNKYEKDGGKNIILLLWAENPTLPLFNKEKIKELISQDQELVNFFKKIAFREIYLVDSTQNIPIFLSQGSA